MMNSCLWYKIGDFTVLRIWDEDEANKKINELTRDLSPYFYEPCVVPVGTQIGPNAEVKISIDTKTNKTFFEIRYQAPQLFLPRDFSKKMWQIHVLECLYGGVSKYGTERPLLEANTFLDRISNSAAESVGHKSSSKRSTSNKARATPIDAKFYHKQLASLDRSELVVSKLRRSNPY